MDLHRDWRVYLSLVFGLRGANLDAQSSSRRYGKSTAFPLSEVASEARVQKRIIVCSSIVVLAGLSDHCASESTI